MYELSCKSLNSRRKTKAVLPFHFQEMSPQNAEATLQKEVYSLTL